jgi:hypothetical protein
MLSIHMNKPPVAPTDRPYQIAAHLREARGERSRSVVVGLANTIPGAPDDLGEKLFEDLEVRKTELPRRLLQLPFFAEAIGVSPFTYLRDLGLWPPPGDSKKLAEELIQEACKLAGWKMVKSERGIVASRAA